MKKIILVVFVVAIFLIIFIVFNPKKSPTSFTAYNVDGKNYRLMEAKNPADWIRGLMFYKNKNELKGADGMIFIFPVKQKQSFWNENTYLNLDLYWLDGEKLVGKSYLPSISTTKEPMTVNSPEAVDRVVEIVR